MTSARETTERNLKQSFFLEIRMFYREIKPRPPLQDLVDVFWVLEFSNQDFQISTYREKVIPSGYVELVFHYGTQSWEWNEIGESQRVPRSALTGQLTKPKIFVPTGNVGIVAIRFKPWGVLPFFHYPTSEMTDRCSDLRLLWNAEIRVIEETLAETSNVVERILLLQSYLTRKLNDRLVEPRIQSIIPTIIQANGDISITELAKSVYLSVSQFERKFKRVVGLSPKKYASIIRFHHFFELARFHRNWTEIAYRCGYYDQSHFIKEFRSFTGVSPREFFSNDSKSISEQQAMKTF